MDQKYIDAAKILKAISDPKRLQIVDMLSCGELCACVIQEEFNITQPTLSHDMKCCWMQAWSLPERMKNTYYSLDVEYLEKFSDTLSAIFHPKAGCICQKGKPAE
jgi:ArsR family transcriptional regulator